MQTRVTKRLEELKALQASVEAEMTQIETRRQFVMQEMLTLRGAVQALEGLLAMDTEKEACDVDGVVVE